MTIRHSVELLNRARIRLSDCWLELVSP